MDEIFCVHVFILLNFLHTQMYVSCVKKIFVLLFMVLLFSNQAETPSMNMSAKVSELAFNEKDLGEANHS